MFGRRLGLSFVVVPIVMVVLFILVNVTIMLKLSSADRVDVQLAGPPDGGGANYLLVGSDTRAFATDQEDQNRFGTGVGGQRSDTIMVLHTDPDTDRALLVSFPRDLWVNIPGHGQAKINAAFNYGPQTMIDTLSSNFDVPIQHYVEVNFKSFRDIVDAIGTVPVYFPAPARDSFSLLAIPYAGCWHLDGQQSLAFARARHLELFNTSTNDWEPADRIPDIGRIARQQALLREIGSRAADASLSNPFTALSVVDAAISNLQLDSDFGRHDVFVLADGLVGGKKQATLAGGEQEGPIRITIPSTPATRGGQSVLIPASGAEAVLARLRDFTNTTAAPSARPSGAIAAIIDDAHASRARTRRTADAASSLDPVPGGC